MDNKLWILFGKKLGGEASAEELSELESLLRAKPEYRKFIKEVEEYGDINHERFKSIQHQASLNTKWEAFERKLELFEGPELLTPENTHRGKIRRLRRALLPLLSGAAIFILAICLFWFIKPTSQPIESSNNEILAPERGISKIVLPDGTKVWLNSKSKLTYGVAFGKETREVYLTGEAFFDVVHNKSKPFIVNTHSIKVNVLGTVFNVRSYEDERVTETSLIRGKVKVTLLRNPDKEIILKPDEKLVINNSAVQSTGKHDRTSHADLPIISVGFIHKSLKDSLPSEALWLENTLAFDSESFEQVAHRLENWYAVTIEIQNPALKKLKFTGRFQSESLEVALKALQSTTSFKYKITGNRVLIN